MSVIRVLLVEDEQGIQFIVKLSLERTQRFDVTSFDCGATALEDLSNCPGQYDLALVDFRLPAMHGVDFIRKARTTRGYENLPAIIISAALMDPELKALEKTELLGVISKPFSFRALPERVMELYAGRQEQTLPNDRGF
ncbi:response regulator [Novosphingobium sp. PS1R-30]|uniref:Response regulator n=1 Tax=Novosphingobium anseongense TaxID=3133436 RepID=A0ABU8RTJ1_9SPHN|nr:MAG: response regulator [Novosphingobium sp.]